MNLFGAKSKMVYISVSRENFGHRFKAASMAKDRGFLPVYPNIVADLTKTVKASAEATGPSRDEERLDQIRKAAEIWVIGEIAGDEMKEDIDLAKRFGRKIRYFHPTSQGGELLEVFDAKESE